MAAILITEASAKALGWLERIHELAPDTMGPHVEISGALMLLAVAILLLRPPRR